MKKLFFNIIILLSFIACRPQKTIIQESIKVDTFIREQLRVIHEAVNDTLLIPIPCDSTVFLYSKSIPNGQATLHKKGNKLTFILSKNKSEEVSEFQKKNAIRTDIKYKEIIKYRIPLYIWVILFALILLCVIFFYYICKWTI
jgi:hypothetical protein